MRTKSHFSTFLYGFLVALSISVASTDVVVAFGAFGSSRDHTKGEEEVVNPFEKTIRLDLKRHSPLLFDSKQIQNEYLPRVSRRTKAWEGEGGDYNTSVGPLVFEEVPLGVGYG